MTSDQKTIDHNSEDIESFIDLKSKLKNQESSDNGVRKLKSADLKSSKEIDVSYLQNSDHDKYIVFETFSDDIVIIPLSPENIENEMLYDNISIDNFEKLYNKEIPVKHIRDNLYTTPTNFINDYDLTLSQFKTLMNDDCLQYNKSNNKWIETQKYKNIKILALISILSISIIISLLLTISVGLNIFATISITGFIIYIFAFLSSRYDSVDESLYLLFSKIYNIIF